MTETMSGPLKLVAQDLEDLSVLSSMVQDAIVPPADMAYWPEDKAFAIALNRFKWETAKNGPPYARTHAALRVEKVKAVRRKGISPGGDRERLLSLLAVAYAAGGDGAPDSIHLQFAEDRAIRIEVEGLAVSLTDLGDPWPTQWKPGHEMGE
ncbi:DUF2948 family protein [Marivibrio halodurans]|uniref:DUF2948 family protein n=1 Tax=Marivibrio halodurans TaxID=2039722 RepID=A0A8J7RZL1_9PROT|nr:DUF2948 family protein [Marivibrio halodurans]MBP5857612.1 DUF2948 family protein [Marivibrio halodurans]